MKNSFQIAVVAAFALLAGAACAQTAEQEAERRAQADIQREVERRQQQDVQALAEEQRAVEEQRAAEERRAVEERRAAEQRLFNEAGRAELERAREQLEVARAQVERAAQQIAFREFPVPAQTVPGLTWLFRSGPDARIDARVVEADGGLLVTEISPGGAAEEAGVRVGDLIQSIDGVDLGAVEDGGRYSKLLERLGEVEAGDTVKLAVERGGRELDIDVTTNSAPAPFSFNSGGGPGTVIIGPNAERSSQGDNTVFLRSGQDGNGVVLARVFGLASAPWGDMELVPMTEGLGRYFDTDEGLLVVRGPSDESIDIEDGDVIQTIGGRTPNSPEHAIRILGSFEAGETIEIAIMRGGRRNTVEYTVPEQAGWVTPGAVRVWPDPTRAAPAAPAVPLVVEPSTGR